MFHVARFVHGVDGHASRWRLKDITVKKTKSGRWIKVLVISGVFLAISFILVGVGGFFLLRDIAARMTVDPQWARDAVIITLRDGMDDQRVELLNELAAMGTTAQEFLPSIQQCVNDPDPLVSTPSRDALTSIAP